MSAEKVSESKEQTGGVAAVDRALLLLTVFHLGEAELSLADLARRTGLYKSTILRLTESLQRYGFLCRLESGAYALGPELFRLGTQYQRSFHLEELVRPRLAMLAKTLGETSSFYIREGEWRTCLMRVEPDSAIRLVLHEGDRLPIARGAAGKVLLAFGESMAPEFAAIHEQGWAASFGERDPEAASVATPVFGAQGILLGALAVSGVRSRYDDKRVQQLKSVLLETSTELSHLLGYKP
ncbi:IclR family transcriptional regulator [Chromobacterium sp. S0633]|uniref:IclR family transcriptional regulator n=1 Tax=Chromobacterium sp. S0633 TaxID=2957805 RepID=UPI0020A082EB|nr:IclR family transcriptional regulator [Chromobacterium sp. S0633]MCP1289678.1 IclR family transcriptional regulator [Chromobacterium sp. S0633]